MDTATITPVSEAVTITPPVDMPAAVSVIPVSEGVTEDSTLFPIVDTPSDEKNTEEKSLDSHPMNVIGKELARMTRSPRLQ